jgi:hypothetical protein
MSKKFLREEYFKNNPDVEMQLDYLQSQKDYWDLKSDAAQDVLFNQEFKADISAPDYHEKLARLRKDFVELNKKYQQYDDAITTANKEVDAETKAATYHSTLKAKPDELVDWNSTQQSDLVNKAFKDLGADIVDNKTGAQLYDELARNLRPSKEQVAEIMQQAKDEGHPFAERTPEEVAYYVGQSKASIALAEQGVAGNVHNSQFGSNKQHRNYVVFDDTKLETNFVALASRPKGAKAGKFPPNDWLYKDAENTLFINDTAFDIIIKNILEYIN